MGQEQELLHILGDVHVHRGRDEFTRLKRPEVTDCCAELGLPPAMGEQTRHTGRRLPCSWLLMKVLLSHGGIVNVH